MFSCKRRLFAAFTACCLAPTLAHADIYKYVDQYGRVYLTDRPSHSGFKQLVKTWKGWSESAAARIDFAQLVANRKRFGGNIEAAARDHQLPLALVHAVITAESAYDPNAVSRAGAVGLMQLMPATAQRYGVGDRRDPQANLQGGTRYLKDLLGMFNNDVRLAVAAYNAGENAVISYGRQVPPYAETQAYVKAVLQYYREYERKLAM